MRAGRGNARLGRPIRRATGTALVALLVAAPLSLADSRPASVDAWRQAAAGPSALSLALAAHSGKLGPEFRARLRYAHADGTLRVMVTARGRNAATESFVKRATTWSQWYRQMPGLYAAVTPAQLATLLASPAVTHVEADYPVDYSLSISARDVGARGRDEVTAGSANGDVTVSASSPTASWEGDAPATLIDAANILVDAAGLHRVCVAPICDTKTLAVADRGDLTIAATATETDWVDLEVIAPDGTVAFRFGDSTAPLTIKDANPGTYTVNAWVNTIAVLNTGHYTATATLGPDSGAPPAIWRLDRTAGALGALASADAGLDAGQATGRGVTVAVIDSGIDKTHPDFGGFACQPGPFAPCDSRIKKAITIDHLLDAGIDPGDGLPTTEAASGHGTHVAGIIAGNGYMARAALGQESLLRSHAGIPIGIAPQASLVSIKNGDTLWAGLGIFGLEWLGAHAQELGVRVASNSWGCPGGCAADPEGLVELAEKALYDAGVLVVFAAGNDGGTEDGAAFSGQSQSPYVLSVANYDAANHVLNSSSSRGLGTEPLPDPATWTPQSEPGAGYRRPDLGAPGTSVWSTRSLTGGAASIVPRVDTGDVPGAPVPEGTGGYIALTGTSMSTPHVAGAAALLFSACPSATVLDAMRALMASADPNRVLTSDGTATAAPFEIGYGGLDVRGALDWLRANTAAC
jgi:subtilisin family serine protease